MIYGNNKHQTLKMLNTYKINNIKISYTCFKNCIFNIEHIKKK